MGACQSKPDVYDSTPADLKSRLNGQQQASHAHDPKDPQIYCSQGKKVTNFCVNVGCKNDALCCDSEFNNCSICKNKHSSCDQKHLSELTKIARARMNAKSKLINDFEKAEEKFIHQLNEDRKKAIQNYKIGNLDEKYSQYYQSIFSHPSTNVAGINGAIMKSLLQTLTDQSNQIKYDNYLNQYQNEGSDLIKKIEEKRNDLIQSTIIKVKEINSKIIDDKKEDGKSKLRFMMKQLENPSEVKLLYRGSQNNFQAEKFHKLCDKIPHTITIVYTEFEKTIAAYTPIPWEGSEGKWVADLQGKSFLMQLDLKKKMSLRVQCQKKALWDTKTSGPVFGGDDGKECDLWIKDKCDKVNNMANFPFSYNLKEKPYSNGQESIKAFTGSQKGSKFKIKEYEVYQVIK